MTFAYVVKHIDDITSTETDITAFVKGIPVCSETGTGEVNYAKILLNCLGGKFINNEAGNEPYIDKFDKITIKITDDVGYIYQKVFEVKTISPPVSKSGGNVLELDLIGIEHNLQQINYSFTDRFKSAWLVSQHIITNYIRNKGSKQPSIFSYDLDFVKGNGTTHGIGSELPSFTVNTYPYGENEDSCYNRLIDIADKLGTSVDAGGVLEFFEVDFVHDVTIPTRLDTAIFKSGERTTDQQTFTTGQVLSPHIVPNGNIETPEKTRVVAWGDRQKGSLPVDFSEFEAEDEAWLYTPDWVSGESYLVDSKIQYGLGISGSEKKHYKCKLAHTSSGSNKPPNATYWTEITKKSTFGDVIQYSPWTDDKADVWRNCGCDPKNINARRGCFDGNIIIWTQNFYRTWANDTVTSASIVDASEQYNTGEYPKNYRLLVRGAAPAWVGSTDINGVSTTNSIVEILRINWGKVFTNAWVVKYKFTTAPYTATNPDMVDMQTVIIKTAQTYNWTGVTLNDISASNFANDCFHPGTITNAEGVDERPAREGWTKNINSAIKASYTFPTLAQGSFSQDRYKVGAWLSLQFPFPSNNTTISESVGDLYGPSYNGGIGDFGDGEPSTFDFHNMNYTHNGKVGFNNSDSEDLGAISSIAFYMKVVNSIDAFPATLANIPIRCTIIDVNDNAAIQDFILPFRNEWTSVNLPINAFQPFTSQKPVGNWNLNLVPPKEVPQDRLIELHHIKFITFQIQSFYDEQGRFYPGRFGPQSGDLVSTIMSIPGGTIDMYLDGFRFVKPLLGYSGIDTERNLEGDFINKENIGNYKQLNSDLKSEKEIAVFRHTEYDVVTKGNCGVRFGDSFFLRDDRIIPDDAEPNKIKLVAKKIEHSITKPTGGPGGFTTTIHGVKRFV